MSSAASWASVVGKGTPNNGNPSRSLNFPTPFLDFEKHYIPRTVKEVFDFINWCYISDSNVKPALENMAAYPITTLNFTPIEEIEDKKEVAKIQRAWRDILEDSLDIRVFCIMLGLDYFGLGNAFASVYRPFDRYLLCGNCGNSHNIKHDDTKWTWKNLKFILSCNKCKNDTEAKLRDEVRTNNREGINFIRWSPYQIDIKKNKITGRVRYFYSLTKEEKDSIIQGDKEYLVYVQKEFIEAVVNNYRNRGKLQIEFEAGTLFALQRPAMSMPHASWDGWGLPTIIASLRDIFFRNIMRRSQAMVLHEHTIPLRIFSPSSENGNPTLGAGIWKNEIMAGYRKWLGDPSTIITAPVPMNVQQVGGDRGALQLFAESQVVNTDVIKGMNVPREFVEGALTYSGGNVSIRMLENVLMDFVDRINRMCNWVIGLLSPVVGLAKVRASFKPFKMADDIQLKQLMVQARSQGEISKNKLGQILDYEADIEADLIAKENIDAALAAAKAQAQSGVKLQKMQEYNASIVPTADTNFTNPINPEMVGQLSDQVSMLPDDQQKPAVDNVKGQNPAMGGMLASRMDMTPAGLQQHLLKIMSTPPPMQQQALEDLMRSNPSVAQLFDMMTKLRGPQGTQKTPTPIKANPVQRPPRSATPGI